MGVSVFSDGVGKLFSVRPAADDDLRFIDNAEDLDTVISMHNMLKYSDNYSITSGSLWNYYRNEVNDSANKNNNVNNSITIKQQVNLLSKRQK